MVSIVVRRWSVEFGNGGTRRPDGLDGGRRRLTPIPCARSTMNEKAAPSPGPL